MSNKSRPDGGQVQGTKSTGRVMTFWVSEWGLHILRLLLLGTLLLGLVTLLVGLGLA